MANAGSSLSTKQNRKTIRFTSRDKWKLTATLWRFDDGFGIFSIGKQNGEHRPLDFAPFHVMDAVLGHTKERFATMEEAEAYARSL